MKNVRRRTQNINGGALEDTSGKGKGKEKEKRERKRERGRVREVGNGEGVGSGIITLRGNEKCEEKNSKYQSWEGLEMER